jgi:hypothetical protein
MTYGLSGRSENQLLDRMTAFFSQGKMAVGDWRSAIGCRLSTAEVGVEVWIC